MYINVHTLTFVALSRTRPFPSDNFCCFMQQTVSCVTQHKCLVCDTADMSAV